MNIDSLHIIILAAGYSRRLKKLTKNCPKSVLKINNKRIIEYSLDYLKVRGVRSVTVVVGYMSDLFIQNREMRKIQQEFR